MRENKQIARQELEKYETTKEEMKREAIEIIKFELRYTSRFANKSVYEQVIEQLDKNEKQFIIDAFNLEELTKKELNNLVPI